MSTDNSNNPVPGEAKTSPTKKYEELLENNHNLILTGAPGTGKTYLAKEIARNFIGIQRNDSPEEQEKEFMSKVGFIQFHPSYDYTDFVEGLRPVKKKGSSSISFERRDGVFKEFCEKASASNKVELDKKEKDIKDLEVEIKDLEVEIRRINRVIELTEKNVQGLEKEIEEERIKEDDVRNALKRLDGKYIENNTIKIFESVISDPGYHTSLKEKGKIECLCKLKISEMVNALNEETFNQNNPNAQGAVIRHIRENDTQITKKLNTKRASTNNLNSEIKEQNFNKDEKAKKEDDLKCKKIKLSTIRETKIESKFVFIIDEINRGDISKIFGELFYAIDPGYRGEKGLIRTQYQNLIEKGDSFENGFYVPENVYIIGTMNDIDRSVESMDFAMRRRFAWKEVTAEESQAMFDDEKAWGEKKPWKDDEKKKQVIDNIKQKMDNLNKCIIDEPVEGLSNDGVKIGLTKEYQIGASYFLKYNQYNDFNKLWDYHINGVLFEYLRGTPDIEAKMERLKNSYGYNNTKEQPQQNPTEPTTTTTNESDSN